MHFSAVESKSDSTHDRSRTFKVCCMFNTLVVNIIAVSKQQHHAHFHIVSEQLWSSQCVAFTHSGAASSACIWFHREVVNMPAFSTSLLFWHAQLRQRSSKVSAWGCGHCRSAFTHTNLHFSHFSPQYGWMWLQVSHCLLSKDRMTYCMGMVSQKSDTFRKCTVIVLYYMYYV